MFGTWSVTQLINRLRPSLSSERELGASDIRFLLSRGGRKVVKGTAYRVLLRNCRLPIFIGKSVTIRGSERIEAGPGLHIGDFSLIDCLGAERVEIGRFVTIREGAWLQCTSHAGQGGEGLSIGDRTYIGPRAVLGAGGYLKIGSRCQIGAGVFFSTEEHRTDGEEIFGSGVSRSGINIGDDVWIGNGVHVLDGVQIGNGCVIGAGAVVRTDIPAGAVAVGVPARVVHSRRGR